MRRLILPQSWEVGLRSQQGAENFSRGEKTGTVGAGATNSPGETTQEVATRIKRVNGGPASQEEEDDVPTEPRARPTARAEPSNSSLKQGGKR